MRPLAFTVPSSAFVFLAVLTTTSPALATWGENWGEMVWGMPVSVPSVPAVGLLTTAAWRLRARKALHSALSILAVPMLAGVLSSPAHAQVAVPNTFNDGSVADAAEMNANFDAVLNGVRALLPYQSGSLEPQVGVPYTLTNGTTSLPEHVDANFTTLVDALNTALANRATDCAGAGGSWDAGTSTCAKYSCFLGGYCSQAAIIYGDRPAPFDGWVSAYAGHTQGTEPALAAECDVGEGNWLWAFGAGCADGWDPQCPIHRDMFNEGSSSFPTTPDNDCSDVCGGTPAMSCRTADQQCPGGSLYDPDRSCPLVLVDGVCYEMCL